MEELSGSQRPVTGATGQPPVADAAGQGQPKIGERLRGIRDSALSSLAAAKNSMQDKFNEIPKKTMNYQEAKQRYNQLKDDLIAFKGSQKVDLEAKAEKLKKRYEAAKSNLKDKLVDLKYSLGNLQLRGRVTTAKEIVQEQIERVKQVRQENKLYAETRKVEKKAEKALAAEEKQVDDLGKSIRERLNSMPLRIDRENDKQMQSLQEIRGEMEKLLQIYLNSDSPEVKGKVEKTLDPLLKRFNFALENNDFKPYSFVGFPMRA